MKLHLFNLFKKILPKPFIDYIKFLRKKQRLQDRFSINKGDDILTTININKKSFFIYINPYLNGGVDDDIYRLGAWEPEITDLIRKYLPSDGTFVDIGANIGYHSLYASLIVGSKGKVLAFEPLERLSEQMKRSIRENNLSNIITYNFALSDKTGRAELSLVSENVGASSIKKIESDRVVEGKVEVELNLLDSFKDDFLRLDVIKIDIEGSEFEALLGSEFLLKKFSPTIILEFSPSIYEQDYSGKTLVFYKYLSNLGYNMSIISDETIDLEESIKLGNLDKLHTNILCLHSKG